MIGKSGMHWDLPRIPEHEFLFRPLHDEGEKRQEESIADGTDMTGTENTTSQ